MKLDQISDKETTAVQVVQKKNEVNSTSSNNSGSILELLNPLKSININSDLHSFYNFRESKQGIETLLKAQSNLVFYVLHQNFMCDAVHKEFFKNMLGRFYDLPENLWGYYRGISYFTEYDAESLSGLVLLENGPLYLRTINGEYNFIKYRFKAENSRTKNKIVFNEYSLKHLHGLEDKERDFARPFHPFNKKVISTGFASYSPENEYEAYRFSNRIKYGKILGYWDIISVDDISSLFYNNQIGNFLRKKSLYASLGIDNLSGTVQIVKEKYIESGRSFDNVNLPTFTNEEIMMIRSLSQTFSWTKNYIYANEDLLNLDVLGLNMSVPWDMELVKFFIKKGYGGRMSENKAVFDKVFQPLLTDEILNMIFRLEYEKY